MGDKVDRYRNKVKGYREDSELRPLGIEIGRQLQTKHRPSSKVAMAECIAHLKHLKDLIEAASKAVSEQLEFRKTELLEEMIDLGELSYTDDNGATFRRAVESRVRARDEVGGRANPDLHLWLDQNGMGDIVHTVDINYAKLQGSINEWLSVNPVEKVKDGDLLEGQQLYDSLGITQQEHEERLAKHAELLELCEITLVPKLGTTGI